jgi:hypothetical protein
MLAGSAWLFLGNSGRRQWYIAPIVVAAALAVRWHISLIDTEKEKFLFYAAYAGLNISILTVIVPFFIAAITG